MSLSSKASNELTESGDLRLDSFPLLSTLHLNHASWPTSHSRRGQLFTHVIFTPEINFPSASALVDLQIPRFIILRVLSWSPFETFARFWLPGFHLRTFSLLGCHVKRHSLANLALLTVDGLKNIRDTTAPTNPLSPARRMSSTFSVLFVGPNRKTYCTGKQNEAVEHVKKLDRPNRRHKSRPSRFACAVSHEGLSAALHSEVLGLTTRGPFSKLIANRRLLRYWLKKTSQTIVIDPNNDIFSSGIVRYLQSSRSLVHTIQSLSIAHENLFNSSGLESYLSQKRPALPYIQQELHHKNQSVDGPLLAALMLGLGSTWIHHETGDYGKEHLLGTRALLDILLAKTDSKRDPFVQQAVAVYLGWDQATAFLPHSDHQAPLYSADLWRCAPSITLRLDTTDVLYTLGNLGRYCRADIDTGVHDDVVEEALEEQLSIYEPVTKSSYSINHAFRSMV
ncbi:hypothetical protein BGZ63DRAFT_405091 [Mariannaea sp. PMI_226]|nr:hypothetical protein BGZ63DRAFT_405091 [Mariannaea sp. PMI_226]